jgi:hypothetical protein
MTCIQTAGECALSTHLAEVRAQEQATRGVLHALAHLYKILQDVLCMRFLGSYEARTHGAQQVPATQKHVTPCRAGVQHANALRIKGYIMNNQMAG